MADVKRVSKATAIAWGILALVAEIGPARAQQAVIPSTTGTISIAGTVAASTKVVSGIAGQRIYVTSVALVPVATAVVTFTTGTGANCGTNTANVTGALTFTAGQTLTLGTGNGAVWVLPLGFDLCVTIATAAAPGSMAFSQF